MRELTYTIYALIDPRNDDIRYIGITYDPDRRLEEHLNGQGSNVPKRTWINELRQLGLTPRMQQIETGLSLPVALEREHSLIQHYLSEGKELVNLRLNPYLSHARKQSAKLPHQQEKVKVRLDTLITDAGLRKSELARITGINEGTIRRICRGQPVTEATLHKILDKVEDRLGRSIDPDTIEGIRVIEKDQNTRGSKHRRIEDSRISEDDISQLIPEGNIDQLAQEAIQELHDQGLLDLDIPQMDIDPKLLEPSKDIHIDFER